MPAPATHLLLLLLLLVQVLNIHAEDDKFDAIVVGGGTSGCVLAQTLIEKGKEVLLLERGGRPNKDSTRKETAFNALVNNPCIEIFDGDGVALATGRCLGGASTYNQAAYIQEEPGFLDNLAQDMGTNWFAPQQVADAYTYVRERLAPLNRAPAGSKQETYITELIRATHEATGIPIANVTPGTFEIQEGIWRTHSYLQPDKRYSTDQILDEHNPHLHLKLHTKVTEIVYDYTTQPFTAICVKTSDADQFCVKDGGRIYLSGGAINTPALLIQNGIGPGGHVVDNPKVGQDLSDKPIFILTSFFAPPFVFGDVGSIVELTFSKSVTLSSGNSRRILAQEVAAGRDGDLIDLARFFRVLLPRWLRFGLVHDTIDFLLGFCNDAWLKFGLLGQVFTGVCAPFAPFYQAGCTANAAGFGAFISEPSSKGSVTVKKNGKIVARPKHLTTEDDIEAMGASIRIVASVFPKRTGPSAAAGPGGACPQTYNVYQILFATISLMFNYIAYPSSLLGPNWVEPDLKTKDDKQIGEKASKYIVSAFHFAGTAALGNVVDGNFKVIGVEGLYVADASVIPTTPRVNMGGTAMMIGRLAGVAFD